ncbi:MAG: class I SAM-dependent methyltransferase family protein [Candidatus Caldarchaeum sp.]
MTRPSVKYLGHVALVRLPPGFSGSPEQYAERLLAGRSRVKTVVLIDGVEGPLRIPRVRGIFGEAPAETVHRENGMVFKLDASRLMFSLGNSFERLRMIDLPREGETIVDMFAGVGQFTIPAAKSRAERVYSFEVNPQAYDYLLQNISLNKVEDRVKPFCDDCRNATRHGLRNTADRIIMGYLNGTLNYLSTALEIAKTEAVIHFHELAKPVDGWVDLYSRCQLWAGEKGRQLKLLGWRVVKTYSARMWHYVLDLGLGG